jgi:hypothetical protein
MKSHTKEPANGPIADTMSQRDGHGPHVRLGLRREDLWTIGLLYCTQFSCSFMNAGKLTHWHATTLVVLREDHLHYIL